MPEGAESGPTQIRRPGRPRDAAVDRAILDAALQLLVEEGYTGMSVEGIAARAGVGKTTIYRRWPSKEAIVAATLRTLTLGATAPDTGSARGDLLAIARELRRTTTSTIVGPAISRVLSASLSAPELLDIFRANVFVPRQAALTAVLRRGQARGDVRPDIDIETVVDMLGGTMLFHILIHAPGVVPSDAFIEQVVDTLLRGIATDANAGG